MHLCQFFNIICVIKVSKHNYYSVNGKGTSFKIKLCILMKNETTNDMKHE
jgi:hypothetical protein